MGSQSYALTSFNCMASMCVLGVESNYWPKLSREGQPFSHNRDRGTLPDMYDYHTPFTISSHILQQVVQLKEVKPYDCEPISSDCLISFCITLMKVTVNILFEIKQFDY